MWNCSLFVVAFISVAFTISTTTTKKYKSHQLFNDWILYNKLKSHSTGTMIKQTNNIKKNKYLNGTKSKSHFAHETLCLQVYSHQLFFLIFLEDGPSVCISYMWRLLSGCCFVDRRCEKICFWCNKIIGGGKSRLLLSFRPCCTVTKHWIFFFLKGAHTLLSLWLHKNQSIALPLQMQLVQIHLESPLKTVWQTMKTSTERWKKKHLQHVKVLSWKEEMKDVSALHTGGQMFDFFPVSPN